MSRLMLVGVVWIGAGLASTARAQSTSWVDAVLPPEARSYDFGTVVRGSKIRHVFTIANTTGGRIRIADWRTKCGCTDVKAGAKVIPPGTQTTLEATIDTTKFTGPKRSGLTLVFAEPNFVEIDLNLTCFIRGDVTANPGLIDFGVVRRGAKSPTQTLVLSYSGGRPDWEITQIKTQTAFVKIVSTEQGRSADGQVSYRLSAVLQSDPPNGTFKDEAKIFSNENRDAPLPITIVAKIQGAASIAPSIINFGPVKPGQTVSKTVMVRGAEPFTITRIAPSEPEIKVDAPTEQARTVHNLTLKFTAPSRPGPYHATMDVQTSFANEPPAHLKTFATIVP